MSAGTLSAALLLAGVPAQAQYDVAVGVAAAAGQMQASESRVKAAFVYKFGDYVEWPDSAFPGGGASPLVIAVVDAPPLAQELARIAVGRTVGGHPVQVRALRHDQPLQGVHMVFIGRTDRRHASQVLAATRDQPTLTITEADDGLAQGSMINFVVVADKVRFDVALGAAQAQRLRISSRLLAVARQVVGAMP